MDRTDDHATHGHQFDHQSITAHPQRSVKITKLEYTQKMIYYVYK